MYKLIIFTIAAIIAFFLLVKHPITQPEQVIPANTPLIIKSNLPGTCRVSAITPAVNTKQNIPIVACKVQL
ncbi:hypothetical protein [Citrobacter portucalensis]|uniref:hypothetical protein n=1 Tax=Citrobacter portucalensis TaxID=1639133 RepID=UPI001F2C4E16|nr:hypothetical protein [Citrobacter portucalensis]